MIKFILFALVFLVTTGGIRAASSLDFTRDDLTLDHSKSPNGRYRVVIRSISRVPKGDETPYDTSLFLVALRPHRVVREIAPLLRDFRAHPEADYLCFWKGDSSLVAIVYLGRAGSWMTALEKRGTHWRNITLPTVDEGEDIAHHVPKASADSAKWGFGSVSFHHHNIFFEASGDIDRAGRILDATIHYRYSLRKGRWSTHVDSVSVSAN